eukprot:333427-Alexandrium_andersonii.AAC.1
MPAAAWNAFAAASFPTSARANCEGCDRTRGPKLSMRGLRRHELVRLTGSAEDVAGRCYSFEQKRNSEEPSRSQHGRSFANVQVWARRPNCSVGVSCASAGAKG